MQHRSNAPPLLSFPEVQSLLRLCSHTDYHPSSQTPSLVPRPRCLVPWHLNPKPLLPFQGSSVMLAVLYTLWSQQPQQPQPQQLHQHPSLPSPSAGAGDTGVAGAAVSGTAPLPSSSPGRRRREAYTRFFVQLVGDAAGRAGHHCWANWWRAGAAALVPDACWQRAAAGVGIGCDEARPVGVLDLLVCWIWPSLSLLRQEFCQQTLVLLWALNHGCTPRMWWARGLPAGGPVDGHLSTHKAPTMPC